MTLATFKGSLGEPAPPLELHPLLIALWHDANSDWPAAHNIVQDINSPDACLVHAYLHRKEGDLSNAAYWYRQAGRKTVTVSLNEEWDMIAEEFLSRYT